MFPTESSKDSPGYCSADRGSTAPCCFVRMRPVCFWTFLTFSALLSCGVIGIKVDSVGSDAISPDEGKVDSDALTLRPSDDVGEGVRPMEESKETEEVGKGYETLELPEASEKNRSFEVHIPKWFSVLVSKAKNSKKAKCLKTKEAGGTPEARESPLKLFGYAKFDIKSRKYFITSGLPLSRVNGFRVPIKVGQQDYILQGGTGSVLLFLNCFSEYEIRGSVLTENGRWDDTQQSQNPVFMQVQNVGSQAFGSVKRMVLEQSAEQLLKAIGPSDVFLQGVNEAIGKAKDLSPAVKRACLMLAANWEQFKNIYGLTSMLNVSLNEVQEAWKEIFRADSFQEKAKHFVRLLMKGRENLERERWTGADHIDLNKNIIVTFTMYPRRENGVRATRPLSSNVIKVEEALVALTGLLNKTGLDHQAVSGLFDTLDEGETGYSYEKGTAGDVERTDI